MQAADFVGVRALIYVKWFKQKVSLHTKEQSDGGGLKSGKAKAYIGKRWNFFFLSALSSCFKHCASSAAQNSFFKASSKAFEAAYKSDCIIGWMYILAA